MKLRLSSHGLRHLSSYATMSAPPVLPFDPSPHPFPPSQSNYSQESSFLPSTNLIQTNFSTTSLTPYTSATHFAFRTFAATGGRLQTVSPVYGTRLFPTPAWIRLGNLYKRFARLARSLARSRPLPVPISISGLKKGSWLTEIGSRLMETLLQISSRWRFLRIETLPCAFLQCLEGCRLNSLEELELPFVRSDVPDVDLATMLTFTTALRLRTLDIHGRFGCSIPMPWAQLTDINFFNKSASQELCLEIFSQCISLVRASLTCRGWSGPPPAKPPMFALRHLRALSVTWVGDEVHDMPLLASLSAPALDELRLRSQYHSGREWPEVTFTAFQSRSPNITKLKIQGKFFSLQSETLIAALRHAPSLTHLSLSQCTKLINDVFLHALCYVDDDVEALVPCLHTLAIGPLHEDLFQDGLADMIASRWWTDAELASRSRPPAVACWKQIRLGFESNHYGFRPNPKFRGTMEDLRQTGLVVDLVKYDSWNFDW
ncbi:hypothetical protein MSAN_02318900 [Mycena sanguinolenta]|uniref:Uncharacterized protein n=1 Tax=Mycena sanguinolenta TaxID=230812 RepID=A0A8H6X8I7_9AGAR|nr:hypothetical protein MSAN_02318900 [Mycena sanguinolenta]